MEDLDFYLNRSIKQDEQEVTKAFKIKPNESKINWNEMSLKHVYKLYRAFDEFYPIYTHWIDGREMRLSKMISYNKMIDFQNEIDREFALDYKQFHLADAKAGTIRYFKRKKLICIRCKDYWAGFSEIRLKGSKKISSIQFRNGVLLKYLKNENQEIVLN